MERETSYQVRIPMTLVRGQSEVMVLTDRISVKSLFLRTDRAPNPRELIRVKGILPTDPQEISLLGTVGDVAVPDAKSGVVPGCEVQLSALEGSVRTRWEQFLRYVQSHYPEATQARPAAAPTGALDPVRRRFPRYKAELQINLQTVGSLHTLYTTDVSRGGMFVATDLPLEMGSSLDLQVVHPDTGESFTLEAVVRHRSRTPGRIGVGVEFTNLDEKGRDAFFEFIHDDIQIDEDLSEFSAPAKRK